MITFDRQAGPLQNFNRSHVMVIGRSVSFSDLARPPGGAPQKPQNHPPPSEKKIKNLHAFQNPRNIFEKKNLVGKKNFFASPLCVLRPQEDVFAEKKISVTKNIHQQCLYTWSSLSINVHTISNPQHNDISCIMTRSPSPHKMSRVF